MARPFYLYQRKEIWYVKFRNPKNNKLLPGKSTGTDSRKQAAKKAIEWLNSGILDNKTNSKQIFEDIFSIDEVFNNLKKIEHLTPSDAKRFTDYFKKCGLLKNVQLATHESKTFISFLLSFWNYENSPYIKEKLLHGQAIGRRRCKDATGAVVKYWKPYFKDMNLSDITKADIKSFSLFIADGENLAPKTINNILGAGTVALSWAFKNDLIEKDPGKGLMKFSGTPKKRGILSDTELQKLFITGDWKGNETAFLGSLLAAQSGMRGGEIIALQVRDIGEDRIFVRHSYSSVDGLKLPKNRETREIPILPDIRGKLLDLARKNPLGVNPTSFVFWTPYNPKQPMRVETISGRFNHALESIGISNDERLARGLCFHGLRHLYARKMSDVLSERTAKLTGHKTPSMLEHYADHVNEKDFLKAAAATTEIFGRILDFQKAE